MPGNFPETRERWRHRLPHWEVAGRSHFITIRCAGSLPADVLARVKEIHVNLAATPPASPQFAVLQRQYFSTCEKFLDRGEGFAPFQNVAANTIIREAWDDLGRGAGWQVPEAVAMPNHVHFVMRPARETAEPLRTVLPAFKGRVARKVNAILGRTGAFWQADWFDRWLRHEAEESRVVDYLRQNPVKAGLVRSWQDWPHRISSKHTPNAPS